MKLLVVGLGAMGKNHHRVLSELGHEVTSVDTQNLDADFRSLEEALDKLQFDAAVVSTTTSTHTSIASQICRTSTPILIEKPLGESLQGVEQLQKLARETTTPINVGYIERFNPAIIGLKRLISAGVLGEILSLSFTREGPPDHRPPSSVALDLLSHDLDLAAQLICEAPMNLAFRSPDIREGAQILTELTAWDEKTSRTTLFFKVSKVAKTRIREIRVISEYISFDINLLRNKFTVVGSTLSERDTSAIQNEFAKSLDGQEPLRGLHSAFLNPHQDDSSRVLGLASLHDAMLVHQGLENMRRD